MARMLLSVFLMAASAMVSAAYGREVTLVYVGAYDCPSCRTWEKIEYPNWQNAPQSQIVKTRLVKPRSLKDPHDDAAWPEDLRWLRGEFVTGVPRFFVLVDGKLHTQGYGARDWTFTVFPALKQLAGP